MLLIIFLGAQLLAKPTATTPAKDAFAPFHYFEGKWHGKWGPRKNQQTISYDMTEQCISHGMELVCDFTTTGPNNLKAQYRETYKATGDIPRLFSGHRTASQLSGPGVFSEFSAHSTYPQPAAAQLTEDFRGRNRVDLEIYSDDPNHECIGQQDERYVFKILDKDDYEEQIFVKVSGSRNRGACWNDPPTHWQLRAIATLHRTLQ